MKRMRTQSQALAELKTLDPETPINANVLRRAILSGRVPSVKVGRKFLVNAD